MKFNSIFCAILTSLKFCSCNYFNLTLIADEIQENPRLYKNFSLKSNENEFSENLNKLFEDLTLSWKQEGAVNILYSKDPILVIEKCKITHGKEDFEEKLSSKLMVSCFFNEILQGKYGCNFDVQYYAKIFIINFYTQEKYFHVLPQEIVAVFLISNNPYFTNGVNYYTFIQNTCRKSQNIFKVENDEQPIFRSIYFVIGFIGIIFFIICILEVIKILRKIKMFLKIKRRKIIRVVPRVETIS